MQPKLFTDYILGNCFHKKYKDTFVEQAPTFIHSLPMINFKVDGLGNYVFEENNEFYAPFIQWSYTNKSIGNFFIIFKRYMEKPLNIIMEKPLKDISQEYHEFKSSITAYIRPNSFYDQEGDLVEAIFASIIPETKEVIFVYFYKNGGKVGHLRNNLTNVKMGIHLREEDRAVLSILAKYDKNKEDLEVQKDQVKPKYLKSFTEQPYILLK